jgi:hypothetical protein
VTAGITQDDFSWATTEAVRLRSLGDSLLSVRNQRGELGRAVEFLRLKAGQRSHFYTGAVDVAKWAAVDRAGGVIADLLDGWVDMAQRGYVDAPHEVAARVTAATDLMEQVELLLADRRVHPAAPVVLAGAALEEYLRSIVAATGATVKGKPGISSYAAALRASDELTAQEVKDVTAWAGLRNSAAHGEFAPISTEGARLMTQGVNLFMQVQSARRAAAKPAPLTEGGSRPARGRKRAPPKKA